MNRRFQFTVVISSACIAGLLLFGAVRGRSAAPETPYTHLAVYEEVLSRIQTQYVEEPDMKSVTMGAINGMLEALDPFASYLNADQYKQYLAAKANPKAGTGLLLAKGLGLMIVADAVPGSSAAKAGLSTGDVVESINNISTRDMPLAFAEIILQGDPGTSVEMSVLRSNRQEPQKTVLTRAAVVFPPVSARLVTDQGPDPVGVISTGTVDSARVREIGQKISDLEKQGAKRFLLDLRHCSTGSPEDGVALANLFLDKGLIAYSQGQKISRQDFQAVPSKAVTKLPLVVLTDRATAEAAEVATAALLESKRAEVVGERTFGDAALRSAIKLDDGSAVILSVAKFYGPDGKAIQGVGVTPSIPQLETEIVPVLDDDTVPDAQDVAPPPPAKAGPDLILQKGFESVRQAK
jgi:carboxyl-terminal processing protease